MDIETLEIELNSKCNLKCKLCFKQIDKSIENACNLNQLIEKLNEFKDLKNVTLAGQRSEPTLYKNLFKLINYLNRRKINILLYTNAETHDDSYFKKLSILMSFNKENKIVFSIFGSTQELHEYYRVNSKLNNVIHRYDLCSKYTNCEINWVVFKYNYKDYLKNKYKFSKNRNVIWFLTLPFYEVFNYSCNSEISLPDHAKKYIKEISTIHDGNCTSINQKSRILDCKLNLYKCFLEKYFGTKYCYFCNKSNLKLAKKYKIMNLPEFSGEEDDVYE